MAVSSYIETDRIILPLRETNGPDGIRICVSPTEAQTAIFAAHSIINIPINKPDATVTFATGNTMVQPYAELARLTATMGVRWSDIRMNHLDEYGGASANDPESFARYLRERVTVPLGIINAHFMNGTADNLEHEAARYESLLTPADLVILGIGPGGHIGFNEPQTPFDSRTHVVQLSEETVSRDTARGQTKRTHAITQGIGNITEAAQILLIAYGKQKAEYLRPVLYNDITPDCPASALRLPGVGPKVSLLLDCEAAAWLNL